MVAVTVSTCVLVSTFSPNRLKFVAVIRFPEFCGASQTVATLVSLG